jgi:hypothetical protein
VGTRFQISGRIDERNEEALVEFRADEVEPLPDLCAIGARAATLGVVERRSRPCIVSIFRTSTTHRAVRSTSELHPGEWLEDLADDDVTAYTMPTYPAMRRLYHEAGLHAEERATDYLEAMARKRFVEYHILSYARRDERGL